MSVAVVVITAGRDRQLVRGLQGLSRQRRRPDEVVVVDMAEASVAASDLPLRRVRMPVEDATLPLGAARNRGAEATSSDVIVFLDVDCIPHPDLVGDHARALAGTPGVVACGRVRYLEEGWDAGGAAAVDLDSRSAAHPARPAPARDTVDDAHPELLWSLNMAVDRLTWRRLGGFDEGFRGYGAEDTDLGLRAAALGIPLLWVAGALAYHQWHEPSRLDPARTGEIVANARRFRARWGSWPMEGWLHELAGLGAVRFDPATDVLEELAWRP